MRAFGFDVPANLADASRLGTDTGQGQADAKTQFLAGGTTLVDLMKLNVLQPRRIVNVDPLRRAHEAIVAGPGGLTVGAFAKMSAVADHPGVLANYPAVAQSLQLAASAQLRNMATLGGNVLQKTRCTYYRDTSWPACNKRAPGTGCSALTGFNRNHAVLGVDESCISQYPGDFAVVLAALDAQVELSGSRGPRQIAFSSLHKPPDGRPDIENTLQPGEIITNFSIPGGPWNKRSVYVKIRDRASYEFGIATAAVALELDGDTIKNVRIGLGSVAYRPWRSLEAERELTGKPLTEAAAQRAADVAFSGARTYGHNDYKPELGRRTLVRALVEAQSMKLKDHA